MEIIISKFFSDYLEQARLTEQHLCDENGPYLQAIQKQHEYFAETLWKGADIAPLTSVVALHSIMILLAGIRVVLSGHVVAAFPIFRTALESACYTLLMSEDNCLMDVWVQRHRSADDMKNCRRVFTSAVSDAAKLINSRDPGAGDIVTAAYDAAIDFGAHPNVQSVMPHVTFDRERHDRFVEVNVAGLYSSDSWHTRRALIACLDYGFVVALVLTQLVAGRGLEHQQALQEMIDSKEKLSSQIEEE